MEVDIIPNAGEPPLAKLRGIQFGLMTSDDIINLSVYGSENPVTKPVELCCNKLGLPVAKGICATCNGETVEQCQGHFAHCLLPVPIYHPHHVGKIVALLRKICVSCGQPKRKKAGKFAALLAPGLKKQLERNETVIPEAEENISTPVELRQRARMAHNQVADDDNSDAEEEIRLNLSSKQKRRKIAEVFIDAEAQVNSKQGGESDMVVCLTSEEEDFASTSRRKGEDRCDLDEGEKRPEATNAPSSPPRRSLRKRKSPTVYSANNSATVLVDLDGIETYAPITIAKSGKRKRIKKEKDSQPNGVTIADMLIADPAEEKSKGTRGKCKYCSGVRPDRYPELLIKMEVITKKKGKEECVSKGIRMEIKTKKNDGIYNVAPDYWRFVARKSSMYDLMRTRTLLPSEALKILKRIPDSALTKLRMHPRVARPEALIMECVPVSPNCTRIQDDVFDSTNVSFRQGSDRATLIFIKLLNKVKAIRNTRYGKPKFDAAIVEAGELQSIFAQYLREKGAPKAVPGKERKRKDHSGRLQKRDSRWSLEWLRKHVLGKRGSFSARNVVTGDPYLRVEEIGIPQRIAKHVTTSERVNKLNLERLQECVNYGQSLVGRYRACGAVRLVRGSERLEVTKRTSHELLIGDIVHRHLRDGDLVYVNRPPSLHKHSLLALRIHIQDLPVFSINPAICAPLHGDFDGDCLHVFVPQSEETKAELHQLMTIPAQLLPSPDGKTIVGMSQDNILATHLLTSVPVFLNKEETFQLAMWSTRRLPIPCIVKSVRGPMWAGKQVIDLTIPEDFSFRSSDGAVDIREGELLSYRDTENWLTSTNGLIRILAQYSPSAAVSHLDCSQSALREWLLSQGFSVSLRDFYAAPDQKSRRNMIEELMHNLNHFQNMAANKELIFDEKFQSLAAVQSDMDTASTGDLKYQEVLEDIAIGFFQQQFSEVGAEFVSKITDNNQLLAMARSGSNGSGSKVFQQVGCLGLQLYKGDRLLSMAGNAKLGSLSTSLSCETRWEARGLVRSSLLDGLNPLEFYLHSIAMRTDLFRKSLELSEPGEMFKKLMLFLRDIHIAYDGTIRNKCGLEIIQFSYNTTEGKESVVPGEAVGILAATAIAQPAYQVLRDASANVGSKKIRPLALIQDTLFPRSNGKLKAADRRIILRLKPCLCSVNVCEEKRALRIQKELQPVSIEMLTKAITIQYTPGNSSECDADGVKLRQPWVGHIRLEKKALIQINLRMETVVSALETAFSEKSYVKIMDNKRLGSPIFFSRSTCNIGSDVNDELGCCLHFSASLKGTTAKKIAKRCNKTMVELLCALRDVMMPLILKTTVKGDERMESANIVWEDASWSPCGYADDGGVVSANPLGELVVEVVVQEKLSTMRGSPWSIVKDSCVLIDSIDWRRSSPDTVQEVRHCLGVEAARDFILKRLTLATKAGGSPVSSNHLKLVADLMSHSGDINGVTSFGYRDLLRSLKTSAPFTNGAFRAPIKTFMEAGEKGDEEFLNGVLASSIFGTRVPVGTGADFSLQLQPNVILDNMRLPMQSVDVFDCLANLNSKIKEEFPATPVAVEEVHVHDDTKEAWGASSVDAGDWADVEGGWGGSPSPGQANDWSGSPSKPRREDWDAPIEGGDGVWAEQASAENVNTWSNLPSKEKVDTADWETVPGQATVEAMDGWGADFATNKEHTSNDPWHSAEANPVTSDSWNIDGPVPDAQRSATWDSVPEEVPRSDGETVSRNSCGDKPRRESREFRPSGANTILLGKRQLWPKDGKEALSDGRAAVVDGWTTVEGGKNSGFDNQTNAINLRSPVVNKPEGIPPGWSPRPWQKDGTGQNGFGIAGGEMRSRRLDDRAESDDWRDVIDTVRSVKDILHAYQPEERLKDEDQQLLLTKVLPHHPSSATKVGCGVDYIKVAFNKASMPGKPTKCFYVVRIDGTQDDFSYHKCLKELSANKEPRLDDLYAIAFQSQKYCKDSPCY